MPIVYKKLFHIMEERGISTYRIRQDKVIGQATLRKLQGTEEGHVDTRSIERLCSYLQCQPGDIMEYIPDDQSQE